MTPALYWEDETLYKMSPHKSPNIIKYCVITSTAAIVLIAISLIPVSKKLLTGIDALIKEYVGLMKKKKI